MTQTQSALMAGVGASLAIGMLAQLDRFSPGMAWLMAPLGATAVLVFGVPDSPLANAKNVVLGHLITALIGVAFLQSIGPSALGLALATGTAVSAMLLTRTTHPPAGANPLLIMLTGQGWDFVLTPVLTGAIVIVLLAHLWHAFQRHCAKGIG
ncbi:HPP family protein [Vibrio coralliilyticus]|uniref:HPP family protein n=1 Tax=Vibrio coralliilyticus TaxID=190893 RepID=UPI00148B4530|nr:HPP family protein [Vibrio coralliilyticus]NOI31437.1 HPP family protein [Vibrio coralliilyticus]NOI50857.1 HPP family protein [Vibrio coralliilyticus]